MDENGDNIPRPESPFSFQRLLCGDDWQRWDTFPTVDANTNSSDVTVESDGPNPLLMTLGMVICYHRRRVSVCVCFDETLCFYMRYKTFIEIYVFV